MANNRKRKKPNYKGILFLAIIIIIAIIFLINKNHKTQQSPVEANQQTQNQSESTSEIVANTQEVKPSIVSSLSEEEIKKSQERGLPVLMYHFFYDASAGETGRDNNCLEIHDFEEQIKYLSENDYYIPTWDEVSGYISGSNGRPLKSVVLTVDDGDESFFRLAKPVLEKYNFKATSFVITSWYGHLVAQNQSPSIDFQSHSDNMHISGSDGKGAFLTISYEDACADLQASRAILGEQCKVFCYPFGHYNDRCKKILTDCNYTLAFTVKGGRVFPGADPLELPRVRISKGESLNSFISKIK